MIRPVIVMTLKRKFILWSGLLMVLVLTLGTISVTGLASLWRATEATASEYDAMDRADAAAGQIVWLRDALRGAEFRVQRDVRNFALIETQIADVIKALELSAKLETGDGPVEMEHGRAAAEHLGAAARLGTSATTGDTPAVLASRSREAADELEKARQSLATIVKMVPSSARRQITAAGNTLLSRLWWTCFVLLLVLAISAAIHVQQYRTLVRPLLWLRDDMQRSRTSNYLEEVRLRGDIEFRDVAAFFNGLARELAELFRNLEQKIVARSKELVRSERLASVGFLAAGVAHEINNPLSVISGYAELAGKNLRRVVLEEESDASANEDHAEAESLASALEAQDIIREEAFRCKEITARLLSLARGGEGGRQTLRMDELAQQVSVLTKGLKNYRDRRVSVDVDAGDSMEVVANSTEMKQVLLNLTVNALEAVPPGRGEVRIEGRRVGEFVELRVADNGKGMSAETLEHVFEPFFTAKRGAGEPGTGLGLSITHAIVENHGGSIAAASDGPGRGSRFVVRLPAASRAAQLAANSLVKHG
jgi:signal transduction histidine kinase